MSSTGERIDLFELTPEELKRLFQGWGEPAFRAAQVQNWIYKSLANDFQEMTDLPLSLRTRLKKSTRIGGLTKQSEHSSKDGLTRKILFGLDDGQSIETVLMLYGDVPDPSDVSSGDLWQGNYKRRTVCISTQVGCPIGCPFCATGQAGYQRNLTAGEIVAQVIHYARECRNEGFSEPPLTNIVIMGMGEPLMKFDVTWKAIETLTDPARYGIGARRITVSTSGLVPGILRLSRLRSQINLAVSLHAARDDLRDKLVPINKRYPLLELIGACRDYVESTHRRITFEYALMAGVNDSVDQARNVVRLLKGLLCHVNLIPLNPTADSHYRRSPIDQVRLFERVLRDSGLSTTLRTEKGIEIAAGCGQLRQLKANGKPPQLIGLSTPA